MGRLGDIWVKYCKFLKKYHKQKDDDTIDYEPEFPQECI